MDINERVKHLIEAKQMNYSQFADEVDTLRSGISHIVSGRNKPGLEFLQKILKRFDDIDAGWLLTGAGEMYKPKEPPQAATYPEKSKENVVGEKPVMGVQFPQATQEGKNIEKITVFFSDRTFTDFYPEK